VRKVCWRGRDAGNQHYLNNTPKLSSGAFSLKLSMATDESICPNLPAFKFNGFITFVLVFRACLLHWISINK